MTLPLPNYQQWLLLFIGAAAVLLAANLLQWVVRRDRIYILYSVYVSLWIASFGLDKLHLADNVVAFGRTVPFYLFSIIYLELALEFIDLSNHPRLVRWYRIMQWACFAFTAPEIYFNLFSSLWQTEWHETQLNVTRYAVLLSTNLSILYTFVTHMRRTDVLARFFLAGTLALWAGEVMSTITLHAHLGLGVQALDKLPLIIHPGFLMQVGIFFDLALVSLGISYRQRREAIRQLMAEQELIREREQHLRRELEADLILEQLKQQHTEAQMRVLQSQVNPHFLFNALNTLSSLIDETPSKAIDYVDELSSVYRYLLRAGDSELTTLEQEMEFIQSYFHLLRTRYGNGIRTDLLAVDGHSNGLLPPLTLQLLVENAVKHNVVMPDQPLTIRIRTTAERELIIENNIQRRKVRVESNGVGLSNIAFKYKLLNQSSPYIEEVDGWFRVKLPLLQPV